MKIGNRPFFLIATVAAGLLAAGCNHDGQAAPPVAPLPPSVPVVHPIAREVMDWDEFPGRIEAKDSVNVQARVSGYLQQVKFTDGEEVTNGQLLFVIDPRPYQAALDAADAAVQQAQTHLDWSSNEVVRGNRMLASQSISAEEAEQRQSTLQGAVAGLAAAKASRESAALDLEYSRITAPISGRIGRKMVTEGNLINSGDNTLVLANIVSLDPVYGYFQADEHTFLKYLKLARDGKGENILDGKVVCQAALGNETGYPHQGTLDFVNNQVDPTTGTVLLRGIFSNADRALQPGFFARIRVPGSGKYPALLIPDEAVGSDQSQKYVLTVTPTNTVEYRKVALGPMEDGLRVVREGLTSNDWVITSGLMTTRPGMPVTPVTNAPAPLAANP